VVVVGGVFVRAALLVSLAALSNTLAAVLAAVGVVVHSIKKAANVPERLTVLRQLRDRERE
jgi:hypothetical protein